MRMPPIPTNIPGNLSRYLRDLAACVQMALQARTEDVAPRTDLLLYSPDKSVWRVTVGDDGTLTATKVTE